MEVIKARELVYAYGPGKGVCGVSLDVDRGACIGLLGRNGSGKTSLNRLLLGLHKPQSGSLDVFGLPVTRGRRSRLRRTGVLMDSSVHWEQLSGYDNAFFAARSYGLARECIERRLDELFRWTGLEQEARDPVSTYSFGMRRKLSVIQALCHDPELLIMDEPTAGVDPHFALSLAEWLRGRTGLGTTAWICGNDADWIAAVATTVLFMDRGVVIAEGTVDALIEEVSPFSRVRMSLGEYVRIPRPEGPEIRSFVQDGTELTLLLDRAPVYLPHVVEWVVANGGVLKDLEVRGTTLREAFLLKTGSRLES